MQYLSGFETEVFIGLTPNCNSVTALKASKPLYTCKPEKCTIKIDNNILVLIASK